MRAKYFELRKTSGDYNSEMIAKEMEEKVNSWLQSNSAIQIMYVAQSLTEFNGYIILIASIFYHEWTGIRLVKAQ
jgi:hypothetical protein